MPIISFSVFSKLGKGNTLPPRKVVLELDCPYDSNFSTRDPVLRMGLSP